MKTYIFISALIIFFTCAASGQSQDSTPVRKQDRAGIGRQDSAAHREQDQRKVGQEKTDKFIDRDGDGISDRREQGLGFKRGKLREERQRGKNQEVLGKKGAAGTVQPTGSGTGKPDRGRK